MSPQNHIDSTGKYVLEGRVVTMGPSGTLPDGAIYIDAGVIKAVQPSGDKSPAEFKDAPRVRTGDTIYPGLIELHNHLSYNAIPLWDVPKKFGNNGQWRNHDDYRSLITKPTQVLGKTKGVVEALIRFVECRCLLGGVTTSQGITLASSMAGFMGFYRGVVRNVEKPIDNRLSSAGTSVSNPETDGAEAYLEKLQDPTTCYLQHMSEGIGKTPRGWFLRLRLPNGDWAINEKFCGIHSTALNVNDFKVIRDRGGSMVWSPLSNYLLYGATSDIKAAKEAGILMALGSDWAPSGSKNLLGELKVAWLASEHLDNVFTPKEVVAMVTSNPAKILKWDQFLGTIEPGRLADLVVVNGQPDDEYMQLIEARETSITLIIINGVPRVGQKRLMERFGPGTEEIEIGDSTRILNLADKDSHELVRHLTLSQATIILEDAMRRLPELAKAVDEGSALNALMGSIDAQGAEWQIVLDFDEDDAFLFAADPRPYADFVTEPLELEPITVADDPNYLPALVNAKNPPQFLRKGLPQLYGQTVTIGDADLQKRLRTYVSNEVLDSTGDLKAFLRTSGELTLAARKTIVEQAMILMEQNYVHLPFKKAMHAVDPVQRLRLLRYRLEQKLDENLRPEIEFHNELMRIFNSVRDLHTAYRLPIPFRYRTAWLPFLIETFRERDRRKYMVSKVIGKLGPPTFEPGVEILHWNGTPIHKVVWQNGQRGAGGNRHARLARGLNSLTIRPLRSMLPPDEEWVTLRYRGLDDEIYEWTQEWLVFEQGTGKSPDALLSDSSGVATAFGLDGQTDDIQEIRKLLFAGAVADAENEALLVEERVEIVNVKEGDGVPTILPTNFRAKRVPTSHGHFGYIRIFTFKVTDADIFVNEFVSLAQQLPQDGLIIDVRGNGGGLITAAEKLLQVLTYEDIQPQKAQFVNTSLNLKICENHAPSISFSQLDLGEWVKSIKTAVETGATYSHGYTITDPKIFDDITWHYPGKVVLIVDALCYSATDIFAAGFQDHKIGDILGIHEQTGAGGANVWSHHLLQRLLSDEVDSPYQSLPLGANFNVAIRRTIRSGENAGDAVEDWGVRPVNLHRMTRQDLLESNIDLLNAAGKLLAAS